MLLQTMIVNHQMCLIAFVLLATCGGICQSQLVATNQQSRRAWPSYLFQKETNQTTRETTDIYPSQENTGNIKQETKPRRQLDRVTELKSNDPVSHFKPVTVNPTIISETEQSITTSFSHKHLTSVKHENTKYNHGPEQATLESHRHRNDRSQFDSTSNGFSVNNEDETAEVSPCSCNQVDGLNVVDCSGLSLSAFSPSWFPANTNIILLDENKLTFIPSFAFSHLHDLLKLSVNGNRISKIEDHAFDGLEKLEYLNLEDNDLNLVHSSYPPGVFDSLRNLKELRLKYNLKTEAGPDRYPDDFLGKLENLENLMIDSVGDTLRFGREFGNLTKLSRLEITGNSGNIDETSFLNVRHITDLIFNKFYPRNKISDTALQSLEKLDRLFFWHVRHGIAKTFQTLKPLRGKNMENLGFVRINVFAQDSTASVVNEDGVLDSTKTKPLLEMCVKTFSLTDSHISVLKVGTFTSTVWNRCLQNIDLSRNPLAGTREQNFRLFNLKSIQTIMLETEVKHCIEGPPHTDSLREHNIVTYSDRLYSSHLETLDIPAGRNDGSSSVYSGLIWATVSESLQTVKLQGSIGTASFDVNLRLQGAKSLTYLDLSYNKFRGFRGNITGFDVLQTFILSGNVMTNLVETFFDYFFGLENLYVSECYFDVDFISRKSRRLLKNLIWLKKLDISRNFLNYLASDTFTTNTNLQVINLSKNRFKTIPFDLVNTPNLKVLDLRQNSISTVEANQRHQLDQLARQNGGFRLLLSGNAISCDCDNLPFLSWMRTTDVELDPGVNLTCSGNPDDDSFVSDMDDLESFWRKCNGRFFFSLATSLLLCMTIGFLAVFFVGKYKTFIKSSILQLFTGYRFKGPADYNIGVYIGYALSDYTFPCFSLTPFIDHDLGLRTFVFHRDMNSPEMASRTVDVINDSWRTVLVFSESFLRDEWVTFIYRSAIHSQSVENPSRVVVLVESRLRHRLPAEVSGAVVDDNIIVVSSWAMTYELREQLRTRLQSS